MDTSSRRHPSRSEIGGVVRSSVSLVAIALLWSFGVAPNAGATVITVDTTADDANAGDGACTLREAINNLNSPAVDTTGGDCAPGSGTGDDIHFAIHGSGVRTITPLTSLPQLQRTVHIDGYSQPGSKPNTLAVGSDAVLLVELNAANVPRNEAALGSIADGSSIRGLIINGASAIGILASENWINGNFIGTDAAGSAAVPNSGAVYVLGASNVIGTNGDGVDDPAERNVISTGGFGVFVYDGPSTVIAGNYIGTNASGTELIGNDVGIYVIAESDGVVIGTNWDGVSDALEGNVIAGNTWGVLIAAPSNGGPAPVGNRIARNSIFANDLIGISLDKPGGANHRQSPPEISSVADGVATGTLESTGATPFRLELFASSECGRYGDRGQGEVFLGFVDVETDAGGGASFTFPFTPIPGKNEITATATNLSTGDTSEFSRCARDPSTIPAATATTTPAPTATPVPASYHCYDVHARPPRALGAVTLADAFGTSTVGLDRPKRLCVPATTSDVPRSDADDLLAYPVRRQGPRFEARPDQRFVNEFGTASVTVVTPEDLRVRAAVFGTPPPRNAAPSGPFQCYRVRGRRPPVGALTVGDRLGRFVVDVGRPRRLCAPVDVNGNGVRDPQMYLMCYAARLAAASGPLPTRLFLRSELGDAQVEVRRPADVCVPSRAIGRATGAGAP